MRYNLAGRIDTANAPQVDDQIQAVIDKCKEPVTELVLDCADLEYISSTGLRIVLKYKKLFPTLEVVNVSNDVYSVFEMTGFTRIMTVKKGLRRVDLSQCKLLAQGGNGAVYRVSGEEIIKVQHLADTEQMMLDEIRRAKAAFVLGVPTAISFDVVDCGEGRRGAIYEALNSDTLGRYVHAHPESIQQMAVKYAELLRTIHSTEADETEFGRVKDTYREGFAAGAQYFTPEELAACQEMVDMIPERNTLVHADAHTNNILLGGDGELMFIDMADTALGHPVFDYSGIGLAMICNQASEERCQGVCGMVPAEVNQFLAIALAYRFGLQDPEEIKAVMGRMFHLALMKFALIIGHNSMSVNQMRPVLLGLLRERLFPCMDQVKADIQWFIDRL